MLLGISGDAVRMMVRRGHLPYTFIGKRIFIDRFDLERTCGLESQQDGREKIRLQEIIADASAAIKRVPESGKRVYFIASGDKVKIGITDNIRKRLTALQTSSPTPLRLLASVIGDRATECALHRAFAGYRASGEWFHYEGPVRQLVEMIANKGNGEKEYIGSRTQCHP